MHPSLPVNSLADFVLLGGQVVAGIFDVPVLLGHVRSGKLKALSVTSATRAPTLPDVPTTAEGKLPTSPLKEQSSKIGGIASPGSPQDYAAFLASEQAKWGKVVAAIGFREQTQ